MITYSPETAKHNKETFVFPLVTETKTLTINTVFCLDNASQHNNTCTKSQQLTHIRLHKLWNANMLTWPVFWSQPMWESPRSPVLDFSLSLDTVWPTRSYCSRLDDSCGTSTDDSGPFFHVYTISLMGYASGRDGEELRSVHCFLYRWKKSTDKRTKHFRLLHLGCLLHRWVHALTH